MDSSSQSAGNLNGLKIGLLLIVMNQINGLSVEITPHFLKPNGVCHWLQAALKMDHTLQERNAVQ